MSNDTETTGWNYVWLVVKTDPNGHSSAAVAHYGPRGETKARDEAAETAKTVPESVVTVHRIDPADGE